MSQLDFSPENLNRMNDKFLEALDLVKGLKEWEIAAVAAFLFAAILSTLPPEEQKKRIATLPTLISRTTIIFDAIVKGEEV